MTAKKPPSIQEALNVLGYEIDLVVARKGEGESASVQVEGMSTYSVDGMLGREFKSLVECMYKALQEFHPQALDIGGAGWAEVLHDAATTLEHETMVSPGYILADCLSSHIKKRMLAAGKKKAA